MSISLKNVSYSYRGKYQTVRAVNGVSYDFEPGKCYAIALGLIFVPLLAMECSKAFGLTKHHR